MTRGAAADPDATIATGPGTLEHVLWHGHPLATEDLSITGNREAAVRFLTMFPLPS